MIRKDWFSTALWKSIQAEFAAYAEARECEVQSSFDRQINEQMAALVPGYIPLTFEAYRAGLTAGST